MKKPHCKYTVEKYGLSSLAHAISVKYPAGFIQKELSSSNVYAKQPKSFKFNSRANVYRALCTASAGSIPAVPAQPIRR